MCKGEPVSGAQSDAVVPTVVPTVSYPYVLVPVVVFPVHFPEQCEINAQPSLSGSSEDCGASETAVLSDGESAVSSKTELLIGKVWQKSQHQCGCRDVQDALDEGDNRTRAVIASELRGHAWEAVHSPHANYVLAKCIVSLPPMATQPIIDELMIRDRAGWRLSRHKYGCRIVQRLLEQCPPQQLSKMIDDILKEAKSLCGHANGNFVIQCLFEHGSEDARRELAVAVLECMPQLASDPSVSGDRGVGPAVVDKALKFAPEEEQLALARALLQAPKQLRNLASQRYGDDVALALTRMKDPIGAEAQEFFNTEKTRQALSSWRRGRQTIDALHSTSC